MFAFAMPVLLASMQVTNPVIHTPIVVEQEPATVDATPPSSPSVAPAPPSAMETGIIVTARPGSKRVDPFEDVNVQAFDITQSVDKAITGPMAMGYKRSLPGPIRYGIRNFLSNLQEPVVFLNYLAQLKPGKALETVGRFGINTTLGLLGLFDTAKKKPFFLPRRKNGFGYTLGYYGVKPGPFLYLPLIGPTTVRELVGRVVDLSVLPYAIGKPFNDPLYAIPTTVVRLLDKRAEADEEIVARREGDEDPYTALKKQYLEMIQRDIDALHGKPRP